MVNHTPLHIAKGKTAESKVWANVKTTWPELVARLAAPVKTGETAKEYAAADKQERGRIKDVGGFVGGFLRQGRRKPGNVVFRQVVALDMDFADMSFWDEFTMLFDCAAVLHATHSHTEKSPRFRLVLPLDREAQPDEYVAIARRLAGALGIERFDNTTFETSRLMYWPSVSRDVDYYFREQAGPWLCADEVLAEYVDWRDASQWPTAARHASEVRDAAAKQQDPDAKKGIVGAFCRTFDVPAAIDEFLGDVYAPADNGCYTYIPGSTTGGLKIYEQGKFAYSHHGTDPAGGKLCNAFDLVRVHRFGHLDTEGNDGKSFSEMETLARNCEAVKKTIAVENLTAAKYDFAEDLPVEGPEPEADVEWATALEVDGKGNYLASASNLNTIFGNDPRLKNVLRRNVFDNKNYICASVPWRRVASPEPIRDVDFSGLRNYIECVYGIASAMKIDDAMKLAFEREQFHPVTDYLSGLVWDGVQRVDNVLVEYFGCDDTAYHRAAIRKTLVGAVARVFEPGVKFDLMLVLVGDEGTYKSTFLHKMARGWGSDTFLTVHGKEALEQLHGAWIVEIAELSGFRKADAEAIKHFISKQVDSFRPAYGRATENYPRQCVFVGTTNHATFLNDPTGNRRFMPVDIVPARITKSVLDLGEHEIGQLWAEAVALYRAGEPLFLTGEAAAIALEQQRAHGVTDERNGLIEAYLDKLLPENWDDMDVYARRSHYADPLAAKGTRARNEVCVAEVWAECLGREKEEMDRYKTREINEYLKGLPGWELAKNLKAFRLYGRQRYYQRKI